MVRRLNLLLAFSLATILALGLLTSARAGGVFNGGFDGGVSGWYRFTGNAAWSSAQGHSALGSLYLPQGSNVFSSPISVVSSGASLTFWNKKSGCGTWELQVYSYTNNTSTVAFHIEDCNSWDWTQFTYNLSAFVGHDLTLRLLYGVETYFDDFDVSNAGPGNVTEYLNGRFTDLRYWNIFYDGGYYPGFASDPGVGNPLPSLRVYSDNSGRVWGVTYPFVVSGSGVYKFDMKTSLASQGYRARLFQLDGGTGWSGNDIQSGALTTDWQTFSVDVSAFAGRKVVLAIAGEGLVQYQSVWIDNVCPAGGCLSGTPTPIPSASPTQSGGQYPTIDWRGFPTLPPYPTFPPFPTMPPYPTQMPHPTPIYGPGTAVPITGSVSITGVVKIDDSTPVRVKVDDSTPVAVKVDDRTPVRVMFGNGPNYTAVPWQNAGGEQRAPAPGAVLPTMISSPSQSHIEYGQGGSSANPLNFHLAQVDYYFANVGVQPLGLSFNLLIHYYYPDAFTLAGIDILPGLYGLAAVYVLVTIIRQLQAR